jgi:hypothetical protein
MCYKMKDASAAQLEVLKDWTAVVNTTQMHPYLVAFYGEQFRAFVDVAASHWDALNQALSLRSKHNPKAAPFTSAIVCGVCQEAGCGCGGRAPVIEFCRLLRNGTIRSSHGIKKAV